MVRGVDEKARRRLLADLRSGKSRDEILQPYVDALKRCVDEESERSGVPLSFYDPKRAALQEALGGIEAASR